MMSSFLTDVMLLVGFGVFLDTVLIGEPEREKIEVYLDGDADNASLTDRFLRFLTLSHSVVFGRFFSSRLFSFKFFFSAALVSLASFLMVATIQVYLDQGALADVRFDSFQLALIAVFVLFNVSFDYLTIIQTKIFIEASIKAQSVFRAIVFVGSDFIVTMNTFILAYAFFILVVVQYFVSPVEELSFVREKGAASNAAAAEEVPSYVEAFASSEAIQRLAYRDNFEGVMLPRADESEYETVAVYYNSTLNPDDVDLQLLILSTISRMDVAVSEAFQEGPVGEEIRKIIQSETGLGRFVRDAEPLEEELPEVERARLLVNGRIASGMDRRAAYTATYNMADALEDGFPAAVFGNLAVFPLDRFIADTVSSELTRSPVVICLLEDGSSVRFSLTNDTLGYLDDCPEFLTVDFVWHWALTRDFSVLGRNLEDRIVPYNTLLITSLLPTLAFYSVIVLMAVATLLFSYVLKGTKRAKPYFLRAPLSVTCFVLAIPMALFGWL